MSNSYICIIFVKGSTKFWFHVLKWYTSKDTYWLQSFNIKIVVGERYTSEKLNKTIIFSIWLRRRRSTLRGCHAVLWVRWELWSQILYGITPCVIPKLSFWIYSLYPFYIYIFVKNSSSFRFVCKETYPSNIFQEDENACHIKV